MPRRDFEVIILGDQKQQIDALAMARVVLRLARAKQVAANRASTTPPAPDQRAAS